MPRDLTVSFGGPLTSIAVCASSEIACSSSVSLKNLLAGLEPPCWSGIRCLVGMLGPKPPDSVHWPVKLAGPEDANTIEVFGSFGNRGVLLQSAQALDGADVAVASFSSPELADALLAAGPSRLIDLDGRLGSDVEAMAGYEGICW